MRTPQPSKKKKNETPNPKPQALVGLTKGILGLSKQGSYRGFNTCLYYLGGGGVSFKNYRTVYPKNPVLIIKAPYIKSTGTLIRTPVAKSHDPLGKIPLKASRFRSKP